MNVDVSNVANNIAKNINVDVSQVPVTVQVPIGIAANVCGIAANVCGIAANVLGSQRGTPSSGCTATTTSNALDNLVQSQLKKNRQG